MKILWVGCPLDDEKIDELVKKEKGFPQLSANNFQWSMINGIEENMGNNIDILSTPTVGRFPLYPQILFKRKKWNHSKNSNDVYYFYLNISIIKNIIMAISIMFEIMLWNYKNRKDSERVIIGYSTPVYQLVPIYIIKKIFGINYITVIPDFPDDIDNSEDESIITWRYKTYKKLSNIIMRIISKSSGVIALTAEGTKKIENIGVKAELIEGSVNKKWLEYDVKPLSLKNGHKIFYGGSFDSRYGFKELIDAFELIQDDYECELWLCGDGGMKEYVKNKSEKNDKIKYFGVVSYDEFMKLTQESTILINPRTSNGDYTNTSFPSKTFDYLAAQRPVVMCKLPGLLEEYYEYINFIEKEDITGITKALTDVMKLSESELQEIGYKGREFVINNKNNLNQMKKFVDLINYSCKIK